MGKGAKDAKQTKRSIGSHPKLFKYLQCLLASIAWAMHLPISRCFFPAPQIPGFHQGFGTWEGCRSWRHAQCRCDAQCGCHAQLGEAQIMPTGLGGKVCKAGDSHPPFLLRSFTLWRFIISGHETLKVCSVHNCLKRQCWPTALW